MDFGTGSFIKRAASLGALVLGLVVVGRNEAAGAPIFSFSQPPGSTIGLSFATSVFDFTMPVAGNGAGPSTAILGTPDGGVFPNTLQYVDFGGGDPNTAWTVTLGFGNLLADVPGTDVRAFTTQLNTTEGFALLVSGDGLTFTPLGTFTPPVLTDFTQGSVDIDFNGTPLPANAQFLRFVGTQVPISDTTFGFDFDAVGVESQPSAVPEPATLALLGSGLAMVASRRVRRRERIH